jgi:hypothetical protein
MLDWLLHSHIHSAYASFAAGAPHIEIERSQISIG